MKELVKQINIERRRNSETRLGVIEEQLRQNKEDHERIIERIDHNCALAKENFETINEKLDKVGSNLDKLSWVPWFVKTLLGAGVVAVIALLFELIKGGVL